MLKRKMLRDMLTNKAQYIAIFLMIFLGVFIFSGVNSEWNGLRVHADRFYEETNLAAGFVYGQAFTSDDIKVLQNTETITDVNRRAVIDTQQTGNKQKQITLYISEENTISKPKTMKGEPFSISQDGIWLDQSFAEANHIKVGDTYSLSTHGLTLTKEVKGLILHPELVYQGNESSLVANHDKNGYAFISAKYCPVLTQLPFSQLLIESNHPEKIEKTVSDALGKSNLTFVSQASLPSYSTLSDEINQHQSFGEVFPIVFLLIAVLTTITTVSKMIIHQRLQIGVLKALGFKKKKIIIHYLSHVTVIASLGAFLGYLCGPVIVPSLIFPMMETVYILPTLFAIPLDSGIIMVIGSILLCFISAFIICLKQLKEKPAQAMRPETTSYKQKKARHGVIWERLGFYAQWNIRDVLRNKLRTLIAIIGVGGCMGLLLCAFGLNDSMNQMLKMMFNELQTYDMNVQVSETADIQTIKDKMDGSAVQQGMISFQYNNQNESALLTVQESTQHLKIQNQDLQNIDLPKDGIAISYKLAEKYQIEANDTLSWRLLGTQLWVKSKVSTIIHTPSSQGITMSDTYFQKHGYDFIPTAIVGNRAAVKNISGVSNIQYKKDIENGMTQMMDGMNLMIVILMFGAIVLGMVVLYNIGTFSYMEKVHEMATLKVLGFHNQQVKKLLRQQNFWISVIGIFAGIPFGYGLINTIISTSGDSMDMIITIYPITFIGCSGAALLVSVLVMRWVSRKIKKVDMVSALKTIE